MEGVAPFAAVILVTAAFQLAFRYARPRRVWPVALALILIVTAVVIWWEQRGFMPTSPYTFAPMLIVPALLSGGLAHAGRSGRWPWPVTTIAGAVAAIVAVPPMLIVGCLWAEAMSLQSGCRF
jgi:hypothetical protein